MITFKQFLQDSSLTEAVIKNWDVKKVNVDKAIKFLNENCKSGLDAIKNGGLLFRGFGKGPVNGQQDFTIIDSSKAVRTSRDTNNAYQIMMDNSSLLKNYPKREKSFICSSGPKTAKMFKNVHIVIPIDSTQLAVSTVVDIFSLDIKTSLGSFSPEDMSNSFGSFFKQVGVPQVNGKFVDAKAANAAFSKFTPAELSLLAYSNLFGHKFILKDKNNQKLEDANDILFDLSGDFNTMSNRHRLALNLLAEAYLSGKIASTQKIDKLHDIFKSSPGNMFYALSSAIMNPGTTRISLTEFGNALPSEVEVWFSGKAMVIPIHVFAKILLRLKEQKFPIAKKVLKQFEDEIQEAKYGEKYYESI